MSDIKAGSVEEIISDSDKELEKITQEYKRMRKEIMKKKNLDIKKFKEQQYKKLGKALLDFYETNDVNVVLQKINLDKKIKID